MSGEFYFDFSSNKTKHPYLKKGSGKKMSNAVEEKAKYLKKGEGKLASNYHGETNFSRNRAESVVETQTEREQMHYQTIEEMSKIMDNYKDRKSKK
jgi:hypothetical protein